MRPSIRVLTFAGLLLAATHLAASGPLGIYGIVEKVVFEPNDAAPERIQVWGAFAYVDGNATDGLSVSGAKRGYLYFRLPILPGGATDTGQSPAIRKEWADLKAVAGTEQAVGFGSWGYIGGFGGLQPDTRTQMPPYILERNAGKNVTTDLRVRPASEAPTMPAIYQANVGVVKIPAQGNHARIVQQLKDALKR